MTADWAELPYALLPKVSGRIINEVRGINRVTYDVSASRRRRLSGSEFMSFEDYRQLSKN